MKLKKKKIYLNGIHRYKYLNTNKVIKKNKFIINIFNKIITKGDLIEYYDVSGCYILKPWSYFIWEEIKNFFDNHTGTPQDAPFILNGENKMRDFVNSTLSGARQSLDTSKQIRQDTGMEKEFIAIPNANINQNISQYDDNKSSIEKYDLQVTESLKRINNLMKKIL